MQAEHLDVVPDVAYDGYVVCFDDSHDPAQEPRAADAAGEHGHLHAAAPVRSVVRTRRVRGPSRVGEPLQVGDRVHVIHEIRRVHLPRGPERREARRAAGAVDGSEEDGRGERECVRRSVGGGCEGEPVVRNGAREREQVACCGARQVGVHDQERPDASGRQRCGLEPCAHRRALAATGIAHERRVSRHGLCLGLGRPDDEGRPDCSAGGEHVAEHRATRAAVRALRGSRPSRLLPFAPRKGTTSVGIGRDTSARMTGGRAAEQAAAGRGGPGAADQAASAPGERSIHSRRSNQCEARSAAATAGSVCSA